MTIAITRDGARLARLPINATTLGVRIAELRRPLVTTYAGRVDLARARYAMGKAAELYAALVQPFAPELAGKTRLFISADGPLHARAFDALVAPSSAAAGAAADYKTAQYLFDSYEVEYLPSPAFLRPPSERFRGQRLATARVLAVGYDAPGSSEEIQGLREVWPRRQLVTLESSTATKGAVKRQMPHFGVLHFAVHATADARDPLASHLRLAADSADDGFLHANEIAGTRIVADLVVLSACETNAGPIYSGEGVMGIARAFLASGARAVVGTQWPIGAESAVLMRQFYTRLAAGDAPGTALRAAKLLLRTAPATAHPVYWAGFMLVR